jgi:hypothetical protein
MGIAVREKPLIYGFHIETFEIHLYRRLPKSRSKLHY